MQLKKYIYELPQLFDETHKKFLENIKKENKNFIIEEYTRYTIQPEIMALIGSSDKPESLIYRVIQLEKK